MSKKSCRTCKFLEVERDSLGRRRAYRNSVYVCSVPLPPLPPLPAAVHWSFKPPQKAMMTPDSGEDCAFYTYEKAATK